MVNYWGMTDFHIARLNMVESQVRPNGITDPRIIAAMATVARENFVPVARRSTAYMDEDVQISEGKAPRFLIEAMAFARLLQLAAVASGDKILHIGAATGYGSAVLARLGADVVAHESDAALAEAARGNLKDIANIVVVQGKLSEGVAAQAPYDVIFVEGRIGEMPGALLEQLAEGGRVVAVLGEADMAKACIWTRSGAGSACRAAFDASVAALPGLGSKKPEFVF